ncbi:MAG: class I SAM-dependent methyltransferase [Chlamydiales bacterium]
MNFFLKLGDYIKLFLINLRATAFRILEELCVMVRYYPNFRFLLNDCLLITQYLWRTPYQESKKFMQERGEKEIYIYGETPLTTMDLISRQCGILSQDIVYEIGCGIGRTAFWLHYFIKCQVIGIDYQPIFISRANRIKKWLLLDQIDFFLKDILEVDFQKATVLYLYGTSLEEKTVKQLILRFELLKRGTKIITVSYPLSDYSNVFHLEKKFMAHFPWGRAETYLNIKK